MISVVVDGEERTAADLVALVRACGSDDEAAQVLAMALSGVQVDMQGGIPWDDLSGWVRAKRVEGLLPVVRVLRAIDGLRAVAEKLKKIEPCCAAVIEGQHCTATRDARWCGREIVRVLDGTQPEAGKAER